jgi:hypothetical protein
MSAAMASAAQAEEPFYKVGGARLGSGASKEIVGVKAKKSYILKASIATVTCTANSVKTGGTIKGSAAGAPGTSEETIVYKGCTVVNNGSGCKVVKEEIETVAVKNTLVTNTAGTVIETLYTPVTGSVFTTTHYEGSCFIKEAKVEGSAAAEAWSGGAAVKIGSEPAEAKTGEVNFPATQIKEVLLKGVKTSVGLTFGGGAATLEGNSELKLSGEPVWGVYTK